MNGTPVQIALTFELVEQPLDVVMEFVAFPPTGLLVADWPMAPGGVQRDADGRPLLLHFAPSRWLVPSPSVSTAMLVDAAAQAGAGMVVDVTGKWREYALYGPEAARALACSIDSEAALAGRECAAVMLFDSPCVLARKAAGYAIWVGASYATDFAAAFARLRARP